MILTLKNIRQHQNKTYHFPNKGFVKLAGASGKGKSTIFVAILHCMFGSMEEMVNWEKDEGQIDLDYLGLKITRHMRPNNLKVIDIHGKTWHDDAAQSVINKALGMNEEETSATSYLAQGMDDSLFKMKPADQLRFLQKLAFGEDDPEVVKEKVKNLKTKRSYELEAAQTELASLNHQSDVIQQKITKLELERPMSPMGLQSEDLIAAAKSELTRLRLETTAMTSTISKLNRDLADPAYGSVDSIPTIKQQLKTVTSQHNLEIRKEHDNLAKLPETWTDLAVSEAKAIIERAKKALEYHQVLHDAKEISSKIKASYGIEGSPISWLTDSIAEHEHQKASCSIRIVEINSEIDDLDKNRSIPCPYCSNPLIILKKTIVRHDHGAIDAEAKIADLQVQLEGTQNARDIHARHISIKSQQLGHLKSSRDSIQSMSKPEESRAEAVELLTKTQDAFVSNLKSIESKNKINLSIQQLSSSLAMNTEILTSKIHELEAVAARLTPKNKILERIQELETARDTSFGEMAIVEHTLDAHSKSMAILGRLAVHEAKFNALTEELHNVSGRIASVTLKVTDASEQLKGVLRLKEISDKAAMESLESMLGGINLNIRKYIDQIFPEDGTSVSIQNKKTIDSGEERAKLSMKLSHKGSAPKSMKSWSGGEKSRVALAGQLGLADMYKSPFILIDEALAWLDKENKERCCEVFRSFTTDKLILVIEHGLPDSLVDAVIQV